MNRILVEKSTYSLSFLTIPGFRYCTESLAICNYVKYNNLENV